MNYLDAQRKYCKDDPTKIENYDLALKDNFKGWVIHHRLEFTLDGQEVHTPESLMRLGMYYQRPYYELIYMKRGEHCQLHNKGKGKLSAERRRRISEAITKFHKEHPNFVAKERNGMYGKAPWNKGLHKSK